ncbi:hypothetical protein COE15_23045 [Bacillus cereus]|uniref:hypothetical protein n=1 Tax=Bacillus sp. AFS023182 TaxID=2033492 RepID=UPI000BF9C972|nr:hypothetical protein [Bacillus sp. AFS023182]PFD95672.1 hypothetical protein CN288_25945 [Bacillus sp. AFS023182]PGX93700.1 hypothetical protein COE15_23045 [Bacillus cereus]
MMQKAFLVVTDWDNDHGRGSQVDLFLHASKAISHGKEIVEDYLKKSKIKRESFTGKWDELHEDEFENGYTFESTYGDAVFYVHVYEKEFNDQMMESKEVI